MGEGSETARRLGRFSSAFVASIEQHQELNLTSRYWSTCRSKSIPFFTLWLVLNEKSRADGNKDSHYYTGRLGVPYFTTQVYKRNFPCLSISLVVLLGFTFQLNCKFSEHVRLKLTKANKCLHILRTLRKELFSQKEIDHLFKTLVLPILTYGLAVYGASDSDLNVMQRFLDRCHKRHFTPQTVSIFNLLEQQD